MPPSSSSTSSSEPARKRARASHRQAVLQVLAWTLLFAAALDVAVNLTLRPSDDPKRQPSALAHYFEYGRSVEAKLRRLLGTDDAHAGTLAAAGWIGRECAREIPSEPGHKTIAFYGMSFSNDVGAQLAELDPSVRPVFFAGPAAPPSHSLACLRAQQAHAAAGGHDASEVQVLGVLASSVKGLLSMTGATTGFEAPAPFTYPRYRLAGDGELQEVQPLAASPADWRRILADGARWRALRQQLAGNDVFYSDWLVEEGAAERSSLVRMLRRAYAQHRNRVLADAVLGPQGFRPDSEATPLLKAVVLDFARRSRSAGKRPLVLLLHDAGSGDSLHRLLSGVLAAEGIDYVSTHAIAPASDPANFVADGHFSRPAYRRIARELQAVLARGAAPVQADRPGQPPQGAAQAPVLPTATAAAQRAPLP